MAGCDGGICNHKAFEVADYVQIVLADWFLAWAVSLTAAYVLCRMPIVRRFV